MNYDKEALTGPVLNFTCHPELLRLHSSLVGGLASHFSNQSTPTTPWWECSSGIMSEYSGEFVVRGVEGIEVNFSDRLPLFRGIWEYVATGMSTIYKK